MSKDGPRRRKIRNGGDELPVTLRALRERAGLTETDGASADLREFFAESKFSGDPTRETAIAMVALDAVLRDPTFLDATTCFGEGQIDTAAGAARLILGEKNIAAVSGIKGEDDLVQLAGLCQSLSKDRDVKAGCMAARHLWGVCNTSLRTFPAVLFKNGSYDTFQVALLATAARHLGSFNPETNDIDKDLRGMVARAEKIAELGGDGQWHKEPETDKELAETVIFLAKQGKFSELRDSSLVDSISGGEEPSSKAAKLLGMRKSKGASRGRAKSRDGDEDWTTSTELAGNGAFFAGRTYEEVKARYPGYPGHTSESSYWDSCVRHPATHGICSRLFSKVPLLTKVGGVQEGLSRAVTNKMVHHNTKFSRLSLRVKLSNGKEFWVHRTRPINWASHGVTSPPFAKDGQMDLFDQPAKPAKPSKSGKQEQVEVRVVGFELKVMNYSHMPWVNKAISQYVEEAPFISTPSDEHQTCLSVLSKALRDGGVQYRDSVEKAAELYSFLPGRGSQAAEKLANLVAERCSLLSDVEDCEAELAGALRARAKTYPSDSELKKQASGTVSQGVAKGVKFLESLGISPEEARRMVSEVAGEFPVREETTYEALAGALAEHPGVGKVSRQDLSHLGKLVTGLASRSVREAMALTGDEKTELARAVGKAIGAGITNRDEVNSARDGVQAESVDRFLRLAEETLTKRGLQWELESKACAEVLADAVDIAPEIEIGLAQSGAILGDKERGIIFSYCAKHAAGKPLSGQDLHNRAATFGGGLTISLDAPVGEDGKDDLYSVFSGGAEHDPEEEAYGGNEAAHWLDAEKGTGLDSGKPSFMPDGGDEFFTSFGVESMTEDLYRVVSTKGDESQKALLEEFASFNIEAIGARGGVTSAKSQISAMLDLLDREDSLPRDDATTRRRALAWVFHSVLNSVGFDEQGFCRMGGAVDDLREALHSKIKRHGMPGVLVLDGEPSAGVELISELNSMQDWGYHRVGISLPASSAEPLGDWCNNGSARSLAMGIGAMSEEEAARARMALSKLTDGGIGSAAAGVISGEAGEDSEAGKYLESNPRAGERIMECLASEMPELHNRLLIFREVKNRGMQVDCLGANGPEWAADAAKLDSALFVRKQDSKEIAKRLDDFGVSAAVVEGSVRSVLGGHPDYNSAAAEKSADRLSVLKGSQVPLPKKLILAAMVSHETEVK